jgi:hypothetical protein
MSKRKSDSAVKKEFVVIREYCGTQPMTEVFEKLIEQRVTDRIQQEKIAESEEKNQKAG